LALNGHEYKPAHAIEGLTTGLASRQVFLSSAPDSIRSQREAFDLVHAKLERGSDSAGTPVSPAGDNREEGLELAKNTNPKQSIHARGARAWPEERIYDGWLGLQRVH
jgi:hypothetical protein